MKFTIFLLSALGALTVAGCSRSADHTASDGHDHGTETQAAEEHDHVDEPETIVLDDHQAEALGLTVETVTATPFANVVRTGGALEAAPGDRATVTATTAGIVSFGGRQLTEGSPVARGSAFLVLGSAGMAEGNYPQQLADARAELVKAEADYARAKRLSPQGAVSGAELSAAQLAVEVARRKVAVLSENATQGGKGIVAPISGYVTTLSVGEGDYVTAGQPLATISANRNLVLRADVPQRFLNELAEVSTANFTTPYDGVSHDLAAMKGRLLGTARAVADGSPTLPLRFEFENRSGLTPGTVVEVFLKGELREGVITVPQTALTEEQGTYYLYLRTAPGHYRKQAVELGASDGCRVEITRGLVGGEEVVTRGGAYVRLAGMSTAIPHGHSH